MSVPQQVLTLVENFDRNRETYTSSSYNETQLRREFLDPLFVALGWDVNNTSGYAEAYKDVIHEDSIKIGSATKAPDYCFRIGGTRKFFLEAKKPAIDIKHDIHPAFQLRRYAWSAKLPLSILTDFEEFAVYDGRVRPVKTDKAATARVKYIKYNEYPDRWDEIADIFSRDAILKGSFDKYAVSTRRKGTAEVDAAFLSEIETWRDSLARNIALRNSGLTNRELNFAVQRTVDRILFLRMCEDRGIEIYGQLLGLVNGAEVYQKLCAVFRRADEKYNSGLFYFEQEKNRSEGPDELTPGLMIDDKVLSPILKRLYYPDSPYEFSVLPAEILGNVYEQFLGKVITLTAGHRAKVEDKPEVKKAGGVYYTPTYIVEYIVKNTVGKLLEGKKPTTAAKLKILDPACGSGSFLIGAYQYILDWHLRYYTENGPEQWAKKKNPRVYQNKIDEWKLTTGERKRILLNNIYGVDIDTQAVEVTKLSLLLKVLEGENQASLDNQLKLFHERALPDLSDNIKCGNSLIGPDFYEGRQLELFDDEEMYRINAFDWGAEFPGVFKKSKSKTATEDTEDTEDGGGFDAVIGNPPWGGDIDQITNYIEERYPDSTQSYRDSSKLFFDKAISLTRQNGNFSFIIPSAFMFQPRYIDVRRLARKYSVVCLWNVGDRVFGPRVAAPCCVVVIKKTTPKPDSIVCVLDTAHLSKNSERAAICQHPNYRKLQQSNYANTTQEAFVTFYRKLRNNEIPLEQILDCKDCGIKHQRVGVGMEQKGKSDLAKRIYYEGSQQCKNDHKYLIGSDLESTSWYMNYSTERYLRANYKHILRSNEIVYFNESVFDLKEKIVWRQTSDRIRATIIRNHWFANTLQAGILRNQDYDLRYILGLLNSKFLNFIYIETVKETGRVFPQVKMSKVRSLPFRTIEFSDPSEKSFHDKMVGLVGTILGLHKRLVEAKVPDVKTRVQRQIDSTDRQIDKLVYELYGLTEEEIDLVENN